MFKTIKLASALAAGSLLAAGAYALPVTLSDAQMDVVAGGSFVCPVIKTENVLHAQNSDTLFGGNYYTIGVPAPELTVPMHATNTLENGTSGSPGGQFATPGDTGYTAIWYR